MCIYAGNDKWQKTVSDTKRQMLEKAEMSTLRKYSGGKTSLAYVTSQTSDISAAHRGSTSGLIKELMRQSHFMCGN
jgi:hypothetical protein